VNITDPRLSTNKFILADSDHPLDWQYNEGEPKFALVISSAEKLPQIKGTNGLSVESWEKSNGGFYIAFVLRDGRYTDLFRRFCEDSIESSKCIGPEDGAMFALSHYKHWMRMFKPCNDHLNDVVIEGLIGEMLALERLFLERYEESSVLDSWTNRIRGKQDFIQGDCWYEVKAIIEGRRSLRITSLEQLDRDDRGRMVVISLRRTTIQSTEKINLNNLSDRILEELHSLKSRNELMETLMCAGYEDDPFYDNVNYELVRIDEYDVREGFPRLRRSQVMPGVVSGEYDISLDTIAEYRVV